MIITITTIKTNESSSSSALLAFVPPGSASDQNFIMQQNKPDAN